MAYLKLGEILLKQGIIKEEDLSKALEVQKNHGGKIGEVLINLGFIDEEMLYEALSKQLQLPYYSFSNPELFLPKENQQLDKIIPFDFAINNLVLPLSKHQNTLTCAVSDPLDVNLLDNIRKVSGLDINLVISTSSTLQNAIQKFYKKDLLESSQEHTDTKSIPSRHHPDSFHKLKDITEQNFLQNAENIEEAAIEKLVDLIINHALEERATDIHIEPFEDAIDLRYRIDGKLYDIPPPSNHIFLPMVSRIKLLANLDISEKRFPQEGTISLKVNGRPIEMRVSTIPTIWGEKIAIHILDQQNVHLDLVSLGFNSVQVNSIHDFFSNTNGLLLICGPTGSGTSTSLYSLLNEIKDPSKNIITIEHPVEFHFQGVNQIAANPSIGLSTAHLLKATLKQDPDVLFLTEMKDAETALLTFEAVSAGKFVIGSMSTPDGSSALTRFIDFRIPSYIINSIPITVISQRLARRLCDKCKEPYEPLSDNSIEFKFKNKFIYKAKGCDACKGTGYKGRIIVSEILILDNEIRSLISEGASQSLIKDAARKNGMTTIFETGLELIDQGITSIDEICRITANIS